MDGYRAHWDGRRNTLKLQGEIDAAKTPAVARQLEALIAGGAPRILLDLEQVAFADVSLVHALARAAMLQAQRRGALAFCRCSPVVARLFALTGLDSRVRIAARVSGARVSQEHDVDRAA